MCLKLRKYFAFHINTEHVFWVLPENDLEHENVLEFTMQYSHKSNLILFRNRIAPPNPSGIYNCRIQKYLF